MKTLELKDIIGYLPYKLNFINTSGSEEDDTIYTLKGLSTYHGAEYELSEGQYSCVGIEYIVPILRPLSDLKKPIKVESYNNNEEFIPMSHIYKEGVIDDGGLGFREIGDDYLSIYSIRDISNLLYQWHFDIHNLIDKGLPLNINTINKD